VFSVAVAVVLAAHAGRPTRGLVLEAESAGQGGLRLGVLPADEPERIAAALGPLLAHLGRELGRPVDLVVSSTYEALGQLLEHGKVDLAWTSETARARWRHRLSPIPLARVVRRGRATYRGVILVRANSPARCVADLRGSRFLYVDRESGSGFLAANRLLAAAGLDPLEDLSEIVFTYGHDQSIVALARGQYDAAAVHEGALEACRDRIDASGLRVLARSEPLPNDVLVASPDLPPALSKSIADRLCRIGRTARGREALAALRRHDPVDGFEAITSRDGRSR
jgi:phosphonate transport system substrate-binding protein